MPDEPEPPMIQPPWDDVPEDFDVRLREPFQAERR